MLPQTHQDDLYIFSLVLVSSLKKVLKTKAGVYLSSEPEIVQKKIVEFGKRMRVDGLEKFGDRTVFSSVRFFRDMAHLERNEALGALILYIPVAYIARLMKLLEYPFIDEDDDALVLDACGTVTNLLAGQFVKDIADLGYVHLQMSHFDSFINTALNGVEFSFGEDVKHEMTFEINGQKRMAAELTMGKVPRSI